MKKHHIVNNPRVEGELLLLNIDGQDREFKLKEISYMLEKASEKERSTFEVSPTGYGIYWPLLDEDISIDGLLGIVHKPEWRRKTA